MWRMLQIILLFACCIGSGVTRADFTFAAVGDTPYTVEEEPQFVQLIAEMNREALAFVVHVGDFKSGWSPCTDALFAQRRDWFMLLHHPLIYTPGDNEWTDCGRAFGARREPLERLQKLRRLFFADTYSMGQRKIILARQSAAYPEHARWEHQGVVFATLNVPGGNNAGMAEEFAARSIAIDTWISRTFDLARAQRSRAVVVAFQANPFSRSGAVARAYAGLMKTLARETSQFNGEVLLIHGDTHHYRMDQPLRDAQSNVVRNFTRIEVFGYPTVNWVRIRVAMRDGRVTFSATPGG